mmetsp:Transcript_7932/g.9005  ORF Transcript_7932/g.9005 Transcript_7932/m.9005 type:complete len:89 (+) Transcript_7932:188-454(+)
MDQSAVAEEKERVSQYKAIDLVSYIKQTVELIVNQKEEELLMRVFDEQRKQEQRKIKQIRNFIEFKCKDAKGREEFMNEKRQEDQEYK